MKRTAILTVVLLALVAASASAAFPGRNGAIVYGKWSELAPSDVSPSLHTFMLEQQAPDGRTGTLVDCGDCREWLDPAVSPDGSSVAFALDGALGLVSIDGTDRRTILFHAAGSGAPAFSPTGARLAFATGSGISVVNVDGTGVRRLVADADAPAWSTRNWIAFVRDDAIYRIRPDGRGLRLLVRDAVLPSWSPVGTRLAFSRPRRHPHGLLRHGLDVARGDGSQVRSIPGSNSMSDLLDVAWSPNGRRLLVSRDLHGLLALDLRGRVRHTFQLHGGDINTPMGVDWQAEPDARGVRR